MANILVVSGHPDLEHSLANKTIIEGMKEAGLSFTLNDLGAKGFNFDVEKEQELLVNADTIVFQFPVYWYSYPALMKYWVEKVFLPGFAYGSEGTVLQGKKLLVSLTTGSPAGAYTHEGFDQHTIDEFLYSIKGLAALCGMEWVEPEEGYACAYIPGVSPESDKDRIIAQCKEQGAKVAKKVSSL